MTATAESRLLDTLSEEIERQLGIAIERFQNMEEKQLLYSSSPDSWNIAQCLWHLNSYGHFYLPQIQRALVTSRCSGAFESGWLGRYFTNMMKPGKGKRKMKAYKAHVPPAKLRPYDEVAIFIGQMETLLGYLQQARQADLNVRIPISISRFIMLKLGDVFQFLIAHNERHLAQALRNLDE